jgi:hypothetical protein
VSERKTAANNLTLRLGTMRAQLALDIKEIEDSGYNPTTPQIQAMVRRMEDDYYEILGLMEHVASLEPNPTQASEAGLTRNSPVFEHLTDPDEWAH